MATIFTKIIDRQIPANVVAEDDRFIAFLDINPLVSGHTLVVPKKEVDYIFDLEDEELGNLMAFAKRVAAAIKKSIPCLRIGVSVIGIEVPHCHIHLIPLTKMDDMNFSRPKLHPTPEDLNLVAKKIIQNLT